MDKPDETSTDERRGGDREPLDGAVQVRFDEQTIVGPGQNISEEGVFFVAHAALRVMVEVAGTDEWHLAEVVRVQSMGEGRLGMAVKFV